MNRPDFRFLFASRQNETDVCGGGVRVFRAGLDDQFVKVFVFGMIVHHAGNWNLKKKK
jgi:hypothetical protein